MEIIPENRNRIVVEAPSVKNRLVTYRYKVTGRWSEYFRTGEYSARYSFFTENIPFETLFVPFAGTVFPWAWLLGAEVHLEFCDKEFLRFAECLKERFAQKNPGLFGESSVICVHEHTNMRKDPEGALLIYEGEEDFKGVLRAAAKEKPILASIYGTKFPITDKARTKEADARAQEMSAELGTEKVFCRVSMDGIVDKDRVPALMEMSDADKCAFTELCRMLTSVSLTAPQIYKMKTSSLLVPRLSEELAAVFPEEQRVLSFTKAVVLRENGEPADEENNTDGDKAGEKDQGMDFPPDHEPCVTVVIPVYNTEQYLNECLDSVLSQTYRNLEIICVDDGSTDRSPGILADYASADQRISVIRQENSGLSISRNRGIEAAHGKYLYFLDSDDYINPGHFEKLIGLMERDNLDVCLFNLHPFISPEEDAEQFRECYERYVGYYKRCRDYSGVRTGAELMKMMLDANEYLMSACAYITRTELVKKSGNRFLDGILHEDNLYTFRILLDADRASFYPDVYYERRLAGGSIMTAKLTFRNVEGLFKCFLGMNRYMENMAPEDEKMSAAVTAARRLLGDVRSRYASLKEPEEKKKYQSLSPQEEMLFRALVVENRAVRVMHLEQENAEYHSEILTLKNENRAFSAEKRDLTAQNAKLVDAGAKMGTANGKLLEEKNRLKQKSEELEEKSKELKKKKSELETKNKKLETENNDLKRDLNNIRSGFLYRALHKIKLM